MVRRAFRCSGQAEAVPHRGVLHNLTLGGVLYSDASSLARYCVYFFFFSSRRRHTRFDCDWSSDVCSSDLLLSGVGLWNFRTLDSLQAGRSFHYERALPGPSRTGAVTFRALQIALYAQDRRSEEHTSELQSQSNLVCRLLLEKKKTNSTHAT